MTTPWSNKEIRKLGIEWTANASLEELKTHICACPVLAQPNFDKQFYLQMDASTYSVGAILLQKGEATTSQLQNPNFTPLHIIQLHSS